MSSFSFHSVIALMRFTIKCLSSTRSKGKEGRVRARGLSTSIGYEKCEIQTLMFRCPNSCTSLSLIEE